jgi:hypothetical protein
MADMELNETAFDAYKRGLVTALLAAPEKQAKRIRAAGERMNQETDPMRQRVLMVEIIKANLEGLRQSRLRNSPECREAKKAFELMKGFLEAGLAMHDFRPTPYPSN